jgi:hypothetical protein
MARGRKIALLGGGVLIVIAILAWLNRPRDEPARATVADAVESFRADGDTAGAEGGEREPALGVYSYATRGEESVDSPVLDATHDYDGVSTIVLSEGRCGQIERWQVLDGRWSETEACLPRYGDAFATVVEFHEFFGSGQKDTFRCRGPAGSRPADLEPGERFSSSCKSEDSSIANDSRIVGVERVSVGGEAFEAIHIESRSVFEGASSGTATRDEWRRRSDGLLLRRTVESEADTSDAGGSHYSERYAIRLLSTTPRR